MSSSQIKRSVPPTVWIGIGFLGVSLVWALYLAFVPIVLRERFALDSTQVGWISTLNHCITLFALPFFGAWSDRLTGSRGRRLPFVRLGAPLGAIAFLLLGVLAESENVMPFLTVAAFFHLFMAGFRSPLVSLMPDLTPSEQRSRANGVMNLLGGIGALLAYFGGALALKVGAMGPYLGGALVLAVSCGLVLLRVREGATHTPAALPKKGVRALLKASRTQRDENQGGLGFLLLSLLFWFMGFSSVATFFTSFAKFHLGFSEGQAAIWMGFFALSFMAFAIPGGQLASGFGRKSVILTGLGILVLSVFLLGRAPSGQALPVIVAMVACGGGWALVNVNSLPLLLDSVPPGHIGAASGVYYLASTLGGVLAPPLVGAVADRFGYPALMTTTALFFAVAALALKGLRGGEAPPRFRVFGHRGDSAAYPENTLLAFREALQAGADGIECDLQRTRDGQWVLLHDEDLTRTSGGASHAALKELTLTELKSIEVGRGEKVPTLKQLLELLPADRWLNLELKSPSVQEEHLPELIDFLEAQGRLSGLLHVSSFHHELLIPFARRGVETGMLMGEEHSKLGLGNLLGRIRKVRPRFVNLPVQAFERLPAWKIRTLIFLFRMGGARVLFWTVNDSHSWKTVQSYADGVITDRVAWAVQGFRD